MATGQMGRSRQIKRDCLCLEELLTFARHVPRAPCTEPSLLQVTRIFGGDARKRSSGCSISAGSILGDGLLFIASGSVENRTQQIFSYDFSKHRQGDVNADTRFETKRAHGIK